MLFDSVITRFVSLSIFTYKTTSILISQDIPKHAFFLDHL